MAKMSTQRMLTELSKIDTPSITNVVATYPKNDLCLGLYNPWTENWYTDDTIRCMYPELGAKVGYAVTCIYGMPDPNFSRLSFLDVIDALDASPKPTILVLQQKYPAEIAGKVGPGGRDHGHGHAVGRLRGHAVQRPVARHRRHPRHEVSIPAQRRLGGPRRHGGARR